MAKKTKKATQTPAESPKASLPKAKKKAVVVREDHPGLVVPLLAWAFILIVLGLGDKYNLLDRVLSIWIGGGVTIFLLAFSPIYYNKNYLTPKLKPLVAAMVVLLVAACGGLVWFGSWGRAPVFDGQVSMADSRAQAELSSGVYGVMINGSFKQEKEGATDPKGKPRAMRYTGNYRLAFSASSSQEQIREFTGKFEHTMKRRKLSKKARGYQEIQRTSDFSTVWVKSPGQYEMRLAEISGDLESELTVAVYRRGVIPYILAGLSILCVLLGNFVDHIIRRARVASFIGLSAGAAFGFAIYFYFESSPVTGFRTMAMDILIGGFVGIMLAYGLYSLLKKKYDKIALSKGMNL